MKHLLFGALAGALLCTPALAQFGQGRGGNVGGANQNQFGAGGGAVFQLPPSVQNVVSIDALNTLIIASDGERPGETQYTPVLIKHVYSGGIARLFGGTAVPTAQFASPGLMNGGGLAATTAVSAADKTVVLVAALAALKTGAVLAAVSVVSGKTVAVLVAAVSAVLAAALFKTVFWAATALIPTTPTSSSTRACADDGSWELEVRS